MVRLAKRRLNGSNWISTRPSCSCVRERLADSVAGGVRGIGQPELVVLVVGVGKPEPDRIDPGGLRPPLALAGHLGLARVDARIVVLPVDARDAVERIVLRDGDADKTLIEDIGTADRVPIDARERIRLPSVERPAGLEQIWIARNAVVVAVRPKASA